MAFKWFQLAVFLLLQTILITAESEADIIKRIFDLCPPNQICTYRYNCKKHTNIKDGQGIIDMRSSAVEKDRCPPMKVCCKPENVINKPVYNTPKPPVRNEDTKCGYRNPNGLLAKVTGDNVAEFGEFPWMVAILRIRSYECGGSIIAPNVVLTTAHCVKDPNNLSVRAGDWDRNTRSEPLPHQDRYVKVVIKHENFGKTNHFNNIALLILETPFIWKEHVRPICLPPPNQSFDLQHCYASGWGKDNFDNLDSPFPTLLKKIHLQQVPSPRCQSLLRKTKASEFFELHRSLMCAGGIKGEDMCIGDGGSPLICPIDGHSNRYYQAGIVSYGIDCGVENVPGVYANVAYLREWIDEQFNINDINIDHFTAN